MIYAVASSWIYSMMHTLKTHNLSCPTNCRSNNLMDTLKILMKRQRGNSDESRIKKKNECNKKSSSTKTTTTWSNDYKHWTKYGSQLKLWPKYMWRCNAENEPSFRNFRSQLLLIYNAHKINGRVQATKRRILYVF